MTARKIGGAASRGRGAGDGLRWLALCLLLLPACGERNAMDAERATEWLDSPAVRDIAFHPRRERGAGGARGCEELTIPVGDGIVVGARFYDAGRARPTILFFHGNGEIVADYHDIAPLFVALGVNFLPVDYRGYGRSSGTPTISSMLADARDVFHHARAWLAARQYDRKVIVMGHSLGSAAAIEVASAYPDEVAGLIVESGFADVTALLARLGTRVPDGLPRDALVRQTEKIAAYGGPALFIHGADDTLIPVAEAEALLRACGSPSKSLLKIAGAGHNDLLAVGRERYMGAVAGMVRTVGLHD